MLKLHQFSAGFGLNARVTWLSSEERLRNDRTHVIQIIIIGHSLLTGHIWVLYVGAFWRETLCDQLISLLNSNAKTERNTEISRAKMAPR